MFLLCNRLDRLNEAASAISCYSMALGSLRKVTCMRTSLIHRVTVLNWSHSVKLVESTESDERKQVYKVTSKHHGLSKSFTRLG